MDAKNLHVHVYSVHCTCYTMYELMHMYTFQVAVLHILAVEILDTSHHTPHNVPGVRHNHISPLGWITLVVQGAEGMATTYDSPQII